MYYLKDCGIVYAYPTKDKGEKQSLSREQYSRSQFKTLKHYIYIKKCAKIFFNLSIFICTSILTRYTTIVMYLCKRV